MKITATIKNTMPTIQNDFLVHILSILPALLHTFIMKRGGNINYKASQLPKKALL